ncbi:hypothetical protein G6F56_010186 [Rhizopus delemar]|nr:hypothetical protein G6F56_010186 [Rhizopus delemar]
MVITRKTAIENENVNEGHSHCRRRPGSHHRGPRGTYKKPSQKLRDLAIQYCERMDDKSITQAARELDVKRSTLSTHVNLYRQEGRSEPLKRGRRKGNTTKFNGSHQQFLKDTLDKDCTQTLGVLKKSSRTAFRI